jgi:cytoskeletal protein RodZ
MKKFLIILYIIIFAALAYYVVTLFIDRDFKKEESTNNHQEQIDTSIEYSIDDPTTENTSPNPEDNLISDTDTNTSKYSVTRENCDNNCSTITNVDEKDYCKQVCGLTPTQVTPNSCDDLTELNKDYCLRDKAVKKNDLSLCNEIQDDGIKKQCYNRISEDFIDEVM